MRIKQLIIKLKWLPSHVVNVMNFCIRNIKFGSDFCSYGTIFVRGTGIIKIGNNVTINSCRESNPIGGDKKTIIFAKEKGSISIGNNVGISNSALVALDSIIIDDNVLIGGNCKFYDHDFHSLEYEERVTGMDTNVKHAPIHIKEGAFICEGVTVLKGVEIGKHSIIGAGAVVTKSVPDYEIWAGNPAVFIKECQEQERI